MTEEATVTEEKVDTQAPSEVKSEEIETEEKVNWKRFREAREVERKEKLAAEKRATEKEAEVAALKAAMDAVLNKTSQQHYREHESEETEDERIQKKIDTALAIQQRKYEEERRAREQQEYPSKLVSAYPDFNNICSAENLDYLEFHYPEVAAGFRYMPEGFDKWSTVYKAVKRFLPNASSKKDEDRAKKNFNKPQSMSSGGVTQTGDTAPIMLDEKRRSDNWARMQKVIKGG